MSKRMYVGSSLSMLGGAFVAVLPAAILSISSRQFDLKTQGYVAISISISMFVAQLAYAAIIESRLSSVGTERRVMFPKWLVGVSLFAAAAMAIGYDNATVLIISLPFVLAGLEIGRGFTVAERLDRREVIASVFVGLGAAAGVVMNLSNIDYGLVALAAGAFFATLVRAKPTPFEASRPTLKARGWVVVDTAASGVTFPLLNLLILSVLGSTDVVLFAAIATVSGLLAIPLTFMRMRLLKAHSAVDIALATGAIVLGIFVLLAFEFSGVFALIFGKAWSVEATLLPLIIAALWRASSLLTTIPFAALRRAGHVGILTLLRAVITVITLLACAMGLWAQNLTLIFVGLLAAELLSAVIFSRAQKIQIQTNETGVNP